MRRILFATRNGGKLNYVRSVLSRRGIEVVQAPLEVAEPRSDDLRLIAREKARNAYRALGEPCIALDSGFSIGALGGFPGTYVNVILGTIGIEGIMRLIEDRPRECEFRNCLSYMDGSLREPIAFESFVPGRLASEPRGVMQPHAWSELYLLFVPEGMKRTLAEMTVEEYWEWNDRANTNSFACQFAAWLNSHRLPPQDVSTGEGPHPKG